MIRRQLGWAKRLIWRRRGPPLEVGKCGQAGGRYQASDKRPGYPAVTELRPLPEEPGEAGRLFYQARPLTGRPHQIRPHLAAIGRPIVSDPTYGGPAHPRLMLTAFALEFKQPAGGCGCARFDHNLG